MSATAEQIAQHAVTNADGQIDWAATQAAVEAAIAADKAAEVEAAVLEGLAPMPEDLVPLRNRANELKEQIDQLTDARNSIKEIFGKRLEAESLQGFVLNGKVHARVSHGTRNSIDTKRLKAERPDIWAQYLKVTKYKSVTVN